jgi:uncharacterized OB-fold protein
MTPAERLPADLRIPARRDERTGPWFDALAEGVLMVRHCGRCDHTARPDAETCPACHSATLGWLPACGTGHVVSRIVDHSPAREGASPLVLGLVELDEGPWLHTRLLGGPQEAPDIGDSVELVVLTAADGEPAPAFRHR